MTGRRFLFPVGAPFPARWDVSGFDRGEGAAPTGRVAKFDVECCHWATGFFGFDRGEGAAPTGWVLCLSWSAAPGRRGFSGSIAARAPLLQGNDGELVA